MNEERFQTVGSIALLLLVLFKPEWLAPLFVGGVALVCVLWMAIEIFVPPPPPSRIFKRCPCGRIHTP